MHKNKLEVFYNLTLDGNSFLKLKQIVKEHYDNVKNMDSHAFDVYKLFNVTEE